MPKITGETLKRLLSDNNRNKGYGDDDNSMKGTINAGRELLKKGYPPLTRLTDKDMFAILFPKIDLSERKTK